jgi:hypothetical protein
MLFQILQMKRDFSNILYIASFQIRTKWDHYLYIIWVCRVCVFCDIAVCSDILDIPVMFVYSLCERLRR